MEQNERLLVWEAFSELMAAKEKKGELFYLCKTAAAMEQIEIASSCQRPQKADGGEITNKWQQIFSTNNLKFLNVQPL